MWSDYQQQVFDFAKEQQGCAAVNAVAGSGKTTTSIEMTSHLKGSILFAAFNRHIRDELATKLPFHAEAATYNGFGWGILLKQGWTKLNERKTQNLLRYQIIGKANKEYWKLRQPVNRIISLLKNMACLNVDDVHRILPYLFERFDLDPIDPDLVANVYELGLRQTKVMDYDDQKLMPLVLGLPVPRYDNLIVDEYQDTCPVESQLMLRAAERVFVVGDPDQCIYSFKGTTPDAMDLFCKTKQAVQLPLSICYRCSRAVIQEAQKIVPRIEWSPDAIEGEVNRVKELGEVSSDDFILCRVTCDLVASCLGFIRRGVPAYVKGREIADSLLNVVERVTDCLLPIGDFIDKLNDYDQMKTEALKDNEAQLTRHEDQVNTLKVLCEECPDTKSLERRILDLFDESKGGICHLTIHKSKGLQAQNVYLLKPELLPHPRCKKEWMIEEEMRLKYVAITRAQRGFYYVGR